MSTSLNVLTIATGKKTYVDMATNLARSFRFWNKESGINFYLATDLPQHVCEDIKAYVIIIKLKPDELGEGFSTKLHLDKLAPPGQTLFIDSDCLIFGKIDWIFNLFKGHSVSVVGGYIAEGEWFGDVKKICGKFNVPHLPKFNGGIYYLEKGEIAASVYETARELEKKYDKIGFIRLRNRPNDEVLMALAMQLHAQQPIPDDGTIMSDPQACQGGYAIDVISGNRWLINPPAPNDLHQPWYPFEKVTPVIIHFLGYYTQHYPYKIEAYHLKKILNNGSLLLTKAIVLLTIKYPALIKIKIKNKLRPVYHSIAGYRKIEQSNRS